MSCFNEVCPYMVTYDAPQHIPVNFEELSLNCYVCLSPAKCVRHCIILLPMVQYGLI